MSADPFQSLTGATTPVPTSTLPPGITGGFQRVTGDAFGLGLALVVLPSLALFLGIERFALNATVSLPLTAIFGIMILFGALSLVGTLYQRLKLADPKQALGLPAGSMRAFMALSLIVLFAIISIMVYRSMMEPFKVSGLTLPEREALVLKASERLMGIVDEGCIVSAAPPSAASSVVTSAALVASAPDAERSESYAQRKSCVEADHRFTLILRPPADSTSTDLAKQLLILVGTLMTSVTSFYFAARTATPPLPPLGDRRPATAATPALGSTATSEATPTPTDPPTAPEVDSDALTDGCNVEVTEATPDEELPPAGGGVAS